MTIEQSFASRLASLVPENNVSSFARRCGVSDSAMRKYLTGSMPAADKAMQIADAAGVELGWLITGRGEMRSPAQSNVGDADEAQIDDPDVFDDILEKADSFLEQASSIPLDEFDQRTPEAALFERLLFVSKNARTDSQRAHADMLLSLAFLDGNARTRMMNNQERVFAKLRKSGQILSVAAEKLSWRLPVGVSEAIKTLIFIYDLRPEDVFDALSMIKSDWDGRP